MITIRLDPKDVRRTVGKIELLKGKYKDAVNRAIASAALKVESAAKKNLTANGSVDTGNARAKTLHSLNPAEIEGVVKTAAKYGAVIEFGRRPGTFPPVEPIRLWVRRKLKVQAADVKGVAYLVGRKIKQQGIKPRPYLEPAFNDNLDPFRNRLKLEIKKASKE